MHLGPPDRPRPNAYPLTADFVIKHYVPRRPWMIPNYDPFDYANLGLVRDPATKDLDTILQGVRSRTLDEAWVVDGQTGFRKH